MTQIATIKQASRAYFAAQSFATKQIADAAATCGMHLKTLERTRNPSGVVVDSAKEAFAELERMLGVVR